VTRSTKPASTSWVDGSCCGLICVATVGASPPNRVWRPALRSRSSSATRAPRVLSIGDRPLVGNRPAIQILGSLEAACDDGAVAAVELITLGRPADSFGLSERCLLGAASSSCRRARCTFGPRCRSARLAERKRDHSDQGGWQRRGSIGLRGGQPVRTIPSPPSSLPEPRKPSSIEKRPFLRGFSSTVFKFPVSAGITVSRVDFLASSLCIQKFRSRRLISDGNRPADARESSAENRAFEQLEKPIADSIRGVRTARSIPRERRGAVRHQCRGADDLRPRL